MLDDADNESLADPPNPARVYRDYLLTCRRMGITPTSSERARALLKEWMESFAAGRTDPPTSQ
jgi:hypothetical protein